MTEKCHNNCTRAIISLCYHPLMETIRDYIKTADISQADPSTILAFYDYIRIKHSIPCETGMLFVEKLITIDLFNKYILSDDPQNIFVNSKIELYQWIKPSHLDIKLLIPDSAVEPFRLIEEPSLPTVKINQFMKAIRNLYQFIGTDSPHEVFFPCLIYCLIKSKIRNILLHFRFMKEFKRPVSPCCIMGCAHGFDSIQICCSCMWRHDWNGQEEYYMVSALAALDFIQKMEFYTLQISATEYDYEISRRINKMNLEVKR